jgi:uncharacterized protein YjbI with pentapeptide repeats
MSSFIADAWGWYTGNSEKVNPIVAATGGAVLVWAAIRQARAATRQAESATRQAETASRRHEEQTRADQQRRITETFSRAVEQLASEKTEARVGGVYTLERLSRESTADYLVIMETLTAFIREQSRRNTSSAPTYAGMSPSADIAAALTVIARRPERERDREQRENWRLDLTGSDLRGAALADAHLEGVRLRGALLQGAFLQRAHLNEASLVAANLEGADLASVDFSGANLTDARLQSAFLARLIHEHGRDSLADVV